MLTYRRDYRSRNMTNASLAGIDLSSADLNNANLSYANLTGANLSKVDLAGANLSNANLTSANLTSADLSNANLTGTNVSGVDFTLLKYPLNEKQLQQIHLTKLESYISHMMLILLAFHHDDSSLVKSLFAIKDIIKLILCNPLLITGFSDCLNHIKKSLSLTCKIVNHASFWKSHSFFSKANAPDIENMKDIVNNDELSRITTSKYILQIAEKRDWTPLIKNKYIDLFYYLRQDKPEKFLEKYPEIIDNQSEIESAEKKYFCNIQ